MLVVEDEVLIGMATEQLLASRGFDVVVTVTGQEALAQIGREQRFALAVVDLKLLDLPGETVIEALWRRWPRTPVIVATGYAEVPPEILRLADQGPLAILRKPWGPSQFQQAARDVGCPDLVGTDWA